MGVCLYICWITSYLFYWNVSNSLVYATFLHLLAWVGQFVGHYYFERNRLTLIDSLVQEFLIAPIFVIINLQYLMKLKSLSKKTVLNLY